MKTEWNNEVFTIFYVCMYENIFSVALNNDIIKKLNRNKTIKFKKLGHLTN